ncbi:hypothetical protein BDR03DRAFT_972443 [Suillus americanus]|nr:hypothetical protein BDR03DRAFT_972443 [Suillus americanus]
MAFLTWTSMERLNFVQDERQWRSAIGRGGLRTCWSRVSLVHVVLCSSSRSPCHTGRSGFRSFSIHIYIYIIHACSDYEAPLDSS